MILILLLCCVSPLALLVWWLSSGLRVGLPKAVMLSHRNIAAAVLQFADIEGRYLTYRDVFAGVLPFYHIGYFISYNFNQKPVIIHLVVISHNWFEGCSNETL